MQLDFVARNGLRILVFAAVVVVVLGCSNDTQPTLLPTVGTSTSALTCTASGTTVSSSGSYTTLSNISVVISGGNGPFTITLPGLSAVTSSSPTYSYSGSLNITSSTTGGASYVSVADQTTGYSGSCALSASGTTTTSGGYTSGGYYPGGYVTCSLQFNPGYYRVGQQIVFWIQTSSGESAYLTALNTGEPYASQPTFPIWAPFYIQYSYVGAKQISLYASTASGIPCNGGGVVSDSLYINY